VHVRKARSSRISARLGKLNIALGRAWTGRESHIQGRGANWRCHMPHVSGSRTGPQAARSQNATSVSKVRGVYPEEILTKLNAECQSPVAMVSSSSQAQTRFSGRLRKMRRRENEVVEQTGRSGSGLRTRQARKASASGREASHTTQAHGEQGREAQATAELARCYGGSVWDEVGGRHDCLWLGGGLARRRLEHGCE